MDVSKGKTTHSHLNQSSGTQTDSRCIQTDATKSDFLSRSAERPTRCDLTDHTDAIRIRPITTISDTILKKCIRRAHRTSVYVINYI